MTKKYKLSVIVPVYNTEKYLRKCLDSLINQTLKDIEIIVVNDGTPDNSQIIIDEYAEKYNNIKSIIKENGGLSDARNYAIKYVTGEYLTFVDSDDFVRFDTYEIMYNKAKKENSEVVISNYYHFYDEQKKEKRINKIKNEALYPSSIENTPEILLNANSFAWNKIYKTSWYKENNFMFPKGQWFEDSAIVYNMLYQANQISCVVDNLYYYRKTRADSITNTVNKKIFDIFKSCDSIINFYKDKFDNKELYDVINRICQIHLFARIRLLIKTSPKMLSIKYYRKSIAYLNKNFPKWTKNKYFVELKNKLFYKCVSKKILMTAILLMPIKISKKENSKKSKNKGYYLSNNRLRTIQEKEYEILEEIVKICDKYNLQYFLAEGTLLGAVRHKGFIPWDDDLDISLPRNDYEKFIEIAPKELKNEYYLLNEKSYNKYYLPFSKIVSLKKDGYINMLDKFDEEYKGIYVDIFPIDKAPSVDYKNLNKDYKKIRMIRDTLLLKAKYINPNGYKRKVLNIFSKIYSYKKLYKKLYKCMTKYNNKDNMKAMVNFASSYHPSKQIVEKEVYGKGKLCKFENKEFIIPSDEKTLLKTIYDDYMTLPMAKKRVCRHSFYDEESFNYKYLTEEKEQKEKAKEELEEIRKLQLYELKILKEFDRICKKNNITYYLGEGTLLGAIRHKGFIPWDDDIDIYIPRQELNKFFEIANDELGTDFKLQYIHNIDNYWVQSPKIRYLGKTEFNQKKIAKYIDETGPYIDLFPLDFVSSNLTEISNQSHRIKRYRRMIWLKLKYSKPRNYKEKIMSIIVKFISNKKIHELIVKESTKYTSNSKKYIANFGSYYRIINEVFPANVFGEPKYVKFEDQLFPVPNNYDYVLTNIYGNYMELPPENKRKIKHDF